MKKVYKVISLFLIQAILLINTASAGAQNTLCYTGQKACGILSPKVSISAATFQNSYQLFIKNSTAGISLGLNEAPISISEIENNGTLISDKTTNFRIGEHSFRVPPYLAERVARVHITAIDNNGFKFQKMGIGVGRRKETIAVVLADLAHPENQLLVFGRDDTALLKALGKNEPEEIIALGKNVQFDAIERQDSFLERSNLGMDFLNKILDLSQSQEARPREVIDALNMLAINNPKLKKDLPVNLAFFSKDYVLSFSENLTKHSHVEILRDREQRSRYIAIIDKLNPDNRVVFERRGEQVYILGENERIIIPKIQKNKTQMIYFSDIEEGAQFCRNVTRSLIEIGFADGKHNVSIRKNVQLNAGAYNPDVSVLKVPQVTQATPTGYQIKKRVPELMEKTLAEFPLYILKDDFKREMSVDGVEIDRENSEFIFFDKDQVKSWPAYLSFGDPEHAAYYQHLKGNYSYKGQDYVVYRAITGGDILTSLSFSNDGSFTIKGISWKDGKPVIFRNVKNIALPNIVTQLDSSRFIDIDPVLNDYFNAADFETGVNPVRSTYKFKNGVFEQGPNIKMKEVIDFSSIQEKEDKKINKSKNFKLKIPKTALILFIFAISFFPEFLFATEIGESLKSMSMEFISKYDFLDTFIAGIVIISGIVLLRILKSIKQILRPADRIGFDVSRRDFLHKVSIKGLLGFLILQTGGLAFVEIYKSLKDIRTDLELRPRIIDNLKQLALIYESLPENAYPLNKRLMLPMNYQYWQAFLQLKSKDEAVKAAQIYQENAEAVFKMYSDLKLSNAKLSVSQLLRFIAERISGKNIEIIEKQIIPDKEPKGNKILAELSQNSTGVIAAAIISGPLVPKVSPVEKNSPVKRENKQQIVFNKNKKAPLQDKQVLTDRVELSNESKRLFQMMLQLNRIEQAI